ncbi:DUF819 family protein [Sulfurimonas sp.]|uniref:DUF819 family protein n=1 Tax=Sulfurimonas sp. TaxID=2022749 RepID=UPI0025F3182A|nr:DUF819 family protein [Sulfurimonas sp.]MDD5157348.1 DUF819 family protein [Sulfurimonas sp.]
MISSTFAYLATLALVVLLFVLLERKTKLKVFKFVPVVVMIYLSCMFLAGIGVFEQNKNIDEVYSNLQKILLPSMLFLMLLRVDLRDFFKLGKSLLIAYVLAIFSLFVAFISVSLIFDFNKEMAASFGALSGSWIGGTANMIAVGSALGVSQEAFGYTLIVDSFNYTIWIMFLLFLVPFAHRFNIFTASYEEMARLEKIESVYAIGVKKYWLLISLSLMVAYTVNLIAESGFILLNYTTTTVVLATLLGIFGSFSKLKFVNGSGEASTIMLYLLLALIGSKAVFQNFNGVGVYIFAGFCILVIHATIMVIGAKIFKLNLFSIAVASLASIGGVASASILAAAYSRALVGIGVLMAIMGYVIGTFGGIILGNILVRIAE